MYTHKQIEHHRTTTGLKFIIVPCPRFLGCTVGTDGTPVALMYPDHRCDSETGWKPFYDLKGLNLEDVKEYQPSFILYRLGDGTLLLASGGAIALAGTGTNSATSNGLGCLNHLVKDLSISLMPEIEELPVYQF
jgi:hypothetical protein